MLHLLPTASQSEYAEDLLLLLPSIADARYSASTVLLQLLAPCVCLQCHPRYNK
jgi:hypothetical protein